MSRSLLEMVSQFKRMQIQEEGIHIALPQTNMETPIAPFFERTVGFTGAFLGFHVSSMEGMSFATSYPKSNC